jgi:hypothetical protein
MVLLPSKFHPFPFGFFPFSSGHQFAQLTVKGQLFEHSFFQSRGQWLLEPYLVANLSFSQLELDLRLR